MPIETVETTAWRHLDVARDAIELERTRRVQALAPGESISFIDAPPPPPASMRQAQSAGTSASEAHTQAQAQAQVQTQTQTAAAPQAASAQQVADALQAHTQALQALTLFPFGGLGGGATALLASFEAAATAAANAASKPAIVKSASTPGHEDQGLVTEVTATEGDASGTGVNEGASASTDGSTDVGILDETNADHVEAAGGTTQEDGDRSSEWLIYGSERRSWEEAWDARMRAYEDVYSAHDFRAGVGYGYVDYVNEMTLLFLQPPSWDDFVQEMGLEEEFSLSDHWTDDASADSGFDLNFDGLIDKTSEALGEDGNEWDDFDSTGTDALSEAGVNQTGDTTSLPSWKPIFDDDGNLMPGVVDADAPIEVQQSQLQARLAEEGLNPQQAQSLARETFGVAVVLRDELARQEQLSAAHERARSDIDEFKPGSGADPFAAREEGYPQRLGKLQSNLHTLTEADTPFLIDRNREFVKAQIEKYASLEAAAVGSSDTSLARAYRDERSLFEGTLARLDQRLVEVDYHTALQRYGDRLAERPSRFSAQEINQSLMRFANGQSRSNSAIDNYVRTNLAGDDPKLYLTAVSGGNIATLAGQDGNGAPTTVRTGVNAYSASLRGDDAAASLHSGAGVKVVIGPWREGATNIVERGTFTQCADGSCVSATGQLLSGGSLTEQQLLSRLGEWSNPNALATELNRANPSANWKSGYFGSDADALAVANRGQVGVVLQAPGAPAHMVTIEPIAGSPGMFRVHDTGAGATYDVSSAWVKRFVAGGVWR